MSHTKLPEFHTNITLLSNKQLSCCSHACIVAAYALRLYQGKELLSVSHVSNDSLQSPYFIREVCSDLLW